MSASIHVVAHSSPMAHSTPSNEDVLHPSDTRRRLPWQCRRLCLIDGAAVMALPLRRLSKLQAAGGCSCGRDFAGGGREVLLLEACFRLLRARHEPCAPHVDCTRAVVCVCAFIQRASRAPGECFCAARCVYYRNILIPRSAERGPTNGRVAFCYERNESQRGQMRQPTSPAPCSSASCAEGECIVLYTVL